MASQHLLGKGAYRLELLLPDLVPRACRSWVAVAVSMSGWLVAVAVSGSQASRV